MVFRAARRRPRLRFYGTVAKLSHQVTAQVKRGPWRGPRRYMKVVLQLGMPRSPYRCGRNGGTLPANPGRVHERHVSRHSASPLILRTVGRPAHRRMLMLRRWMAGAFEGNAMQISFYGAGTACRIRSSSLVSHGPCPATFNSTSHSAPSLSLETTAKPSSRHIRNMVAFSASTAPERCPTPVAFAWSIR